MISTLTPLDFIARSGSVYRDYVAVVEGDQRLTYGELKERVHRLASALQRTGIRPGDRVAMLSRNRIPALECHFGVALAGAVLVMLNTRLNASEIATILNHSGARLLLGEPHLLKPLESVKGELKSLERIEDDYEAFISKGDPGFHGAEPEENGVISINYTSGTTGIPKGVMYTHRGAYMNALGEVIEHGISHSSVYLWTLPMFHCNGWCFPWAVTSVGARHICLPDLDPKRAVELIQQEGVTHLCGSPTVLLMLTEYCRVNNIKFGHRLKIVTAGAPPSPAVIRAVEEMEASVAHVYGLTETYGPHTICAWQSQWNSLPLAERATLRARQGVGYVVTGMNVRVVDEQMKDVPKDGETIGEIVMRGNNVMAGYFNDPEATEKAFAGGWFHSGDLAVMQPNGYIEIRDRSKDIIISGGENISSVEVEKVLCDHPAVLEAAVVGVSDPKWGEVPLAYITLREGKSATGAELIEYSRSRLAHFKCPKYVEFRTLPKTSTGKIRKNVLRTEARAAQG
ncbi:MAG TPA: acyl--CoA ligase family protein [Candidatus Limnocylindrales bacterium]|nr:acyl--CoA ligase family protein [Candidatus Limnocylindrales bacterium]